MLRHASIPVRRPSLLMSCRLSTSHLARVRVKVRVSVRVRVRVRARVRVRVIRVYQPRKPRSCRESCRLRATCPGTLPCLVCSFLCDRK